jgi:hypothetical protein
MKVGHHLSGYCTPGQKLLVGYLMHATSAKVTIMIPTDAGYLVFENASGQRQRPHCSGTMLTVPPIPRRRSTLVARLAPSSTVHNRSDSMIPTTFCFSSPPHHLLLPELRDFSVDVGMM